MNNVEQRHYLKAMGIDLWIPRSSSEDVSREESFSTLNVTAANSQEEQWLELKHRVATCQRCDLCKSRTQTVFGVGSPHADLMIIGEAPGMHEDRQGEPFVGRAGKLLDAMMISIGLSREQIYIANVLKCRPPNNRDPSAEEVKLCTDYLEEQVALLQPKLIMTVGRIAAHYLLGVTTPLSRLRGQRHQFGQDRVPLIATYHPAYLLRNPRDKSKAFNDLLFIRQLLGQLQ